MEKNIGLIDIMKKRHVKRNKKPFDDKTISRVLPRLEKKGLVIIKTNVPQRAVFVDGDNKRVEYRIHGRAKLITITEAGKVELRGYKFGRRR